MPQLINARENQTLEKLSAGDCLFLSLTTFASTMDPAFTNMSIGHAFPRYMFSASIPGFRPGKVAAVGSNGSHYGDPYLNHQLIGIDT